MPIIHAPAFGRFTAKVPTTKKRVPSPRAYEAIAAEPSATLRVVAIHPRRPNKRGPTQGAATRPHTSPSKNAPRKPLPPTLERRVLSPPPPPPSPPPHTPQTTHP